jgi:hypothetical protein
MTMQHNLGALELSTAAVLHDGALEQAAMNPNPPSIIPYCRHIDDAGLEQAASTAQPQTMLAQPWCRHIEDSRLEQAAASAQPYTSPVNFACRHIDNDGALEAAAANPQPFTAPPMCHHIEDGAVEAVGMKYEMGPKTIIIPGHPRCL